MCWPGVCEGPEWTSDPLELELLTVVRHYVNAGNQTWVLRKEQTMLLITARPLQPYFPRDGPQDILGEHSAVLAGALAIRQLLMCYILRVVAERQTGRLQERPGSWCMPTSSVCTLEGNLGCHFWELCPPLLGWSLLTLSLLCRLDWLLSLRAQGSTPAPPLSS